MVPVGLAVLSVLLLAGLGAALRRRRLMRLRGLARRVPDGPTGVSVRFDQAEGAVFGATPGGSPRVHRSAGWDDAAAALMGISGAALWDVARIDSSVIRGVSAASSVNGGMAAVPATLSGLVEYVRDNADRFDARGFVDRLAGYVGEQQAGDVLAAQGHLVEFATSPNNPGWDLLVNGVAMNIKTYASATAATVHALAHPEFGFLVPEDALGVSRALNVHVLEGFSYADVHADLAEGLAAAADLAEGLAGSLDGALGGIPVFRVAWVAVRESRNVVLRGKPVRDALLDGSLEAGIRGVAAVAGAQAGAMVGGSMDAAAAGTTLGAGTAVGLLSGAIAGGRAGAEVHARVRQTMRRKLADRLMSDIELYGTRLLADDFLPRVAGIAAAPVERSRAAVGVLEGLVHDDRRTVRWWTRPGADQVRREAALERGRLDLAEREDAAAATVAAWEETVQRDDAARLVGLAVVAAPETAAAWSDHEELQERISASRLRLAQA